MKLNADLQQRVVLLPGEPGWVPSLQPGVLRRMLERDGGEVARATSVVRFLPGSRFPAHEHGGGEEVFVLEGTFSDEEGDYPAGTYLRHPPGTSHTPFSDGGCTFLVKLRQFRAEDRRQVVIDTRGARWERHGPGVERLMLHQHGGEQTGLLRFAPGAALPAHDHPGGEETFVISGELSDEHGSYPAGTWSRQPEGFRHGPRSAAGCLLYCKVGHLS